MNKMTENQSLFLKREWAFLFYEYLFEKMRSENLKVKMRPLFTSLYPVIIREVSLCFLSLGICHVDYQLYDAKSTMIQPTAETDSGRFVVSVAVRLN